MAVRDGTMSESRADKRPGLLPTGTGSFFRRSLIQLVGLALVALAVALTVACLNYHPDDPSWNHAINRPVKNLLRWPGAIAADLMLQYLGAAAFLVPVVLVGWGWRFLRDFRLPRWLLRFLLLPAAVLLVAAALSPFGKPPSWPLETGLGGALGELLLYPTGQALGLRFDALAIGAGALGLLFAFYVLAITRAEWRAVGRGLRWLVSSKARREGRPEPALPEVEPERPIQPPGKPRAKEYLRERPRERQEPVLAAEPTAKKKKSPGLVTTRARPKPSKRGREANQRRLDLGPTGDHELPPLDLLTPPPDTSREAALNRDALEKNARLLESVLNDFGVKGEIMKVRPGPVVTRYELEPAPGTKTSRVVGLADDIARSMSAISVRVAVVPGSSSIGIELPNARREAVYMRELLASESFERAGGKLPLILGKDISGSPVMVDLGRMPHLLMAGTTGSGKSVSINVLILSLLYRFSPEDCKFIMIDPKMLELSVYEGIPHLIAPVVTEPKKAVVALKWTVREMEDRYRNMSRLGVRNIDGYNKRIEEAQRNGEVLTRRVQTGFDPDTGEPITEDQPFDLQPLPQIVVVVDEMADLMLVAGKEIEAAVQRLAQMARAAGIHIVMATQRPSVDVITGTIKANFPTRISFHVTSKIDSRTILGETGAEQLLGQGDMLYMAQGGRITRVHGPLVTDREVEEVVSHLKAQGQPSYNEAITEDEEESGFEGLGGGSGDELYDQAVALVCQQRKASTSFVQRHLQIGYNRAARIIEKMEAEGIVSQANHVGKREILVQSPGDA
jgi:S-DNA-T family DNA segregation ATPase FtsK/SpoIIIE